MRSEDGRVKVRGLAPMTNAQFNRFCREHMAEVLGGVVYPNDRMVGVNWFGEGAAVDPSLDPAIPHRGPMES